MGNSDGIVYVVPVMRDGYLEEVTEDIAKLRLGVRISTLVVTKMLVGSFCYRRFDYAYSNQYKLLWRAMASSRWRRWITSRPRERGSST